ncbi:MAG: hypothetical protein ACREXK_04205 [Gammaproteobacteria bacterium]
MLLSAHNDPGKYTERLLLGAHFQALLRILPPPLALAPRHDRARGEGRAHRLMRERQCTEIEAAYAIAQRLAEGRA